MNIAPSRVGLLFSPNVPIWTGTVSAYIASTFRLTVSTVTGTLATSMAGLCVYTTGGRMVRIKSVDVGNSYLYLAENGLTTATGGGFDSAIAIYNIRVPLPKYQRVLTNQPTVTGDTSNQISDLKLFGTAQDTYYWEFRLSGRWWRLYTDSGMTDDTIVARAYIPSGSSGMRVNLETRRNSGVSGGLTVTYTGSFPAIESGTVTINPYEVRKDYDITYASLGASDQARSFAEQGPVAIVNPEAAWIAVSATANVTFSAVGSFATYYGADHRAPNPDDPATIPSNGYTWDFGSGGVVDTGAGTSVITGHFTTAGFRYITLTVTDSNSVTQTRYIPVWVDVAPETNFVSGSIPFELGTSYRAKFDLWTATQPFRFALVLAVDLDTRDPIFMGWIWPDESEYDFEKQKLSFEVWSMLAFLQNVSARPFELYGQKGDAMDWDHFDMLSVPRAAYFLLRWHSNVMELCNVKFNVVSASVPTAAAADTPLQYIRDITAGTIGQQLNIMAASPFLALYGHALGEIEAILDPLYATDITTATYNAMTLNLTLPDVAVKVKHTLSVPTINDGRLGGFYYDNVNYLPIVVRSPTHPGNWGTPKDEQNFVVSTVQELVNRAGRYVGATNYADTFAFRCLKHIDLKTYKLVDYPTDLFASASRLIIRRLELSYDIQKLLWVETLEAKTFGLTESAGQEQGSGPTPGTTPPGGDPIPSGPTTPTNLLLTVLACNSIKLDWIGSGDETYFLIERSTNPPGTWTQIGSVAGTVFTYTDTTTSGLTGYCYRVRSQTGALYSDYSIEACLVTPSCYRVLVMNPTQLGYTLNVNAVSPVWVNLKVGGLTGANVGNFENAALAWPKAWALTYKDESTLSDNGLWYCADITAPSWTLILSITALRALTGASGRAKALGAGTDGTAYIDSGYRYYLYGTGSMTLSSILFTTVGQFQFACCSGANVKMTVGEGGVPRREVDGLSGGSVTIDFFDTNQTAPPCVQPGFFITDAGVLCSYTGGGFTPIYTGADYLRPLVSDGTNNLNVRLSDGELMNNAATVIDPATAFGAARTFGGYAIGPAGYDEIIAVSNTSAADTFVIIKAAGGAWTVHDGDWTTKMGANWAGGGGGAACAMVILG